MQPSWVMTAAPGSGGFYNSVIVGSLILKWRGLSWRFGSWPLVVSYTYFSTTTSYLEIGNRRLTADKIKSIDSARTFLVN